jgi:8-oxo-dGTP diphosphatase
LAEDRTYPQRPYLAVSAAIVRDGKVERHFVILCFAARWHSGRLVLNEELDDARWLPPAEIAGLRTTEGLAEIIAAAVGILTKTA